MLQTGLFAGFLTALIYSLVQSVTVTPIIYEAERIEFASNTNIDTHTGAEIKRYTLTLLTNIVTSIGFSFLIVAGFICSKREISIREGIWWGIFGYFVFILAPALGLPPEVPGSITTPVEGRQIWWLATVFATATGIGFGFFINNIYVRSTCVFIVILPHIIGAPSIPDLKPGLVPLELASYYVVWTLFTSLIFWLILGATTAVIYQRLKISSRNQ